MSFKYKNLLYIIMALKIGVYSTTPPESSSKPQNNNHEHISKLLDDLLKNYDNSIRPDFGGPPAVIDVDIMVRSMGPISEVDMTYSMDCYFRQSWIDKRLAFPGDGKETLALSISMLAKIWKPDTYFYNGKHSYLHTITTPNKFVRLYQNGRVLYSSRLTIKAGCPMNLEDFPMDIQRCPLKFGSFGYTSEDVVYRWNKDRQVVIAEDMKLSQFDLIATPVSNRTDIIAIGDTKKEYSMLLVSFHLQRHMGNFMIQVYGPCVLLVVLSWVSFWLNREATADRVSLGITTVLTMTFLGLESRTDLPKVPYPTALDYFIFVSFGFIFATIIQFAIVHYFTKYGSGECYFYADFSSDSDSDHENTDDDEWEPVESGEDEEVVNISDEHQETTIDVNNPFLKFIDDPNYIEVIQLSPCAIPIRPSTSNAMGWDNLSCVSKRQRREERPTTPVQRENACVVQNTPPQTNRTQRKRKRRTPRFNSVSKIDRASRIVFPLLYLAINLFYWYYYLSRTNRL